MTVRNIDKDILRAATAKEYVDWLEGYLKTGGKITHLYDYAAHSLKEFRMIAHDIDLPSLYGANALNIIVPKGVHVNQNELGHNHLYFMDDYKVGGGWVPVHTDTLDEMQKRKFFQGSIDKLQAAFALEERRSDAFFDEGASGQEYQRIDDEQEALLREFHKTFAPPEVASPVRGVKFKSDLPVYGTCSILPPKR